MISKSPREINQATFKRLQAEGVEITEETVKLFNAFLFGKINNLLMSLETLELYVPQLGVWKFRRKKGEETLNRISNKPIDKIVMNINPTYVEKAVETYNTRINNLKKLIERHEEMIIARKEFKTKKNDISANKGGSQESEKDLGGSQEQRLEDGTRGGSGGGEVKDMPL